MGDLLGSRARILASYPVCSTWVHVVDALLWPSASTAVDDVPDPAIGGVFRDPLAAVLPNASTIWCAGRPAARVLEHISMGRACSHRLHDARLLMHAPHECARMWLCSKGLLRIYISEGIGSGSVTATAEWLR